MQTAERISHVEASDNVIFQRSRAAYLAASEIVHGTTMEIGSGMGYGIEILAPRCNRYLAIDKYQSEVVRKAIENRDIEFRQMKVPPLNGIPDESADFVVTFQVIEHIKNDRLFVKEIQRVLKPGGQLILTTPNIRMSLTRNPWHIREYTKEQLYALLGHDFSEVSLKGVFGNSRTMEYYERNKAGVKKFTRFDILNMQYWIPRFILKIPYDLLNRLNRKKLLQDNNDQTTSVSAEDYSIRPADDQCFDFFAIATK